MQPIFVFETALTHVQDLAFSLTNFTRFAQASLSILSGLWIASLTSSTTPVGGDSKLAEVHSVVVASDQLFISYDQDNPGFPLNLYCAFLLLA